MKLFVKVSVYSIAFICALSPQLGFADDTVTLSSASVLQGDPLLVHINSARSASDVQKITWNSTSFSPFVYQGNVMAFVAIPLTYKVGTSTIHVAFADGTSIDQDFLVTKRDQPSAPLGIPQSLGGNSTSSATKLVSSLQSDNAALIDMKTQDHTLWKRAFAYPIAHPVVTDSYGYNRDTIGYSIAHKGTDFRADIGTPVMAMNRGVVRIAKSTRTYGKMIVIDHGLGVFTMYMHLSKIKVTQGQIIEQGKEIGLSGNTGYAEGPHLHVSVRIGNTSIDPIVFLGLSKLLATSTSAQGS
jgi:murein DD-endopeptidase MepM/ murein hydrolase activator NlpD